jgi:toxin CptA
MKLPLRVELRASREIAAMFFAGHGLAGAGLWLSPLSAWACCAASAALALAAWRSVHRHAFRSASDSLVAFELYEDCTVSARTNDGRWLRFAIVGSTFTSRFFTVLNLRSEGGWRVRSVLVSGDCIDRDAFRRLRVWLRWYCAGRIAAIKEVTR